MRRKIIKHGPSSHVISLPSIWIKEFKLKKGDEINLDIIGSKIMLNAQETQTDFYIEKNLKGLCPRLVDRFIARAYQKGYDRIKIQFDDITILETILKKVSELIGYEVMERSEKSCVIQSISSNLNIDFHESFKKALSNTYEMLEQCIDANFSEDNKKLKNIYLMDFETNRMCYFCLRQLNKQKTFELEIKHEQYILYYLIESLEDLGDHIKEIGTNLSKCDSKKRFISILKELLILYENSQIYFYNATKENANKGYEQYLKIKKCADKILNEDINKIEFYILESIMNSSNILYHFTTMRLDFIKV